MGQPTMIGIALWIASGVLFLFKALSMLMGKELHFFSIKEICRGNLEWIDKIPFYAGQKAMTYVSNSSLSSVLLVAGLIFIIIGLFKKH
jgi:hypothetical protein